MAVIGFLNYEDFLAELKSTLHGNEPVRVQPYHKSQSDQTGIRHFTFIVEAAIAPEEGDVLVCRFVTARTNNLARNLEKLEQRNQRIAGILRQDLESFGYTVRPGLIAIAADSQTEADPGDLWTEKDLSIEEEK